MGIAILLGLHGGIHLFGFLKWSGLAPIPQLGGRTLIPLCATAGRLFAAGWGVTFLLLVVAAVLRGARRDGWWTLALPGVLLSQGLIFLAWPDAKAGTIPNVVLLVAILVASAHARFVHRVDSEARQLLSAASKPEGRVIDRSDLDRLPAPVARWLEATGVLGRPRATTIRLRQQGDLRTKPDGPWMPTRAEQYFSVDPPAFVWRVDAILMRVLPIAGRDRYARGQGHMLIKAGALVNLADVDDAKIALGALLRYLGEIIWFPSAAVSSRVSWAPIDANHARATLRDGGLSVSAVFTFDHRGRVVRFEANRYLGGGAEGKLTPWFATCSSWRTFDGLEVPDRGEVGWELAQGPFVYYRWQVFDLEFDRTDLYGDRSTTKVRPARPPLPTARPRPRPTADEGASRPS